MILYVTEGAPAEEVRALLSEIDIEEAHEEPAGIQYLRLDEDGLSLCRDGLSVRADFTEMLPRLRQSNLEREMLVKAARIKNASGPVTLLDATAGLGEDSVIFAAAGFNVQMYESNPVVAALLEDALRRAAKVPELAETVSRMELHKCDSISAMRELKEHADVIYLDPMFPERTKSAAVKKKFQLLHSIERPCGNEEELLSAAISARPDKIVIKRPLKGPYLAGIKPSYSYEGKAVRYDCLINIKG